MLGPILLPELSQCNDLHRTKAWPFSLPYVVVAKHFLRDHMNMPESAKDLGTLQNSTLVKPWKAEQETQYAERYSIIQVCITLTLTSEIFPKKGLQSINWESCRKHLHLGDPCVTTGHTSYVTSDWYHIVCTVAQVCICAFGVFWNNALNLLWILKTARFQFDCT